MGIGMVWYRFEGTKRFLRDGPVLYERNGTVPYGFLGRYRIKETVFREGPLPNGSLERDFIKGTVLRDHLVPYRPDGTVLWDGSKERNGFLRRSRTVPSRKISSRCPCLLVI